MAHAVSSPVPAGPGTRWTDPAVERAAVAAFAVVALVSYGAIFLPYLVTADGNLGADYSYFLPQLLAGHFWFHQNGLFAVPWFTPAFCGGLPQFPNVQGLYYSVPQFLTFGAGPVRAVELTFLGFAAAGYWGTYWLLRHNFALSGWSATAGATLFLFNGFYAAHLLVGHLTFHAFMLVPWVAVLALSGAPAEDRLRPFSLHVLGGALVIGYMIYSGMVHALPPSLLAVVAIWLLHGLLFGASAQPLLRLVAMTIVAALIGAAKLIAGFAFLTQFPRDMVPIAGFSALWQVVVVAFVSTSITPPTALATEWLVNDVWGDGIRIIFGHHELDFRITILPALLIVAWLARSAVRIARRRSFAVAPWQLAPGLGLAAILVFPILLNWHQTEWTEFLKSLPILRNSAALIRWHCIFVVVGVVVAALIVDRAPLSASIRALLGGVVAALVVFTNAVVERKHESRVTDYASQSIDGAYRRVAATGIVPPISRIVDPGHARRDIQRARDRSEYMVDGGSSVQCYEPMFGYYLEQYPRGPLHAGPVLSASDGMLNLKNPACMVYPEANECRPGNHFREADIDAARRFVSYRPFEFRLPWWQRLANWTSLLALGATLAVLGVAAVCRVPALRRQLATPSLSGAEV